jgi:hypothetical protein
MSEPDVEERDEHSQELARSRENTLGHARLTSKHLKVAVSLMDLLVHLT